MSADVYIRSQRDIYFLYRLFFITSGIVLKYASVGLWELESELIILKYACNCYLFGWQALGDVKSAVSFFIEVTDTLAEF